MGESDDEIAVKVYTKKEEQDRVHASKNQLSAFAKVSKVKPGGRGRGRGRGRRTSAGGRGQRRRSSISVALRNSSTESIFDDACMDKKEPPKEAAQPAATSTTAMDSDEEIMPCSDEEVPTSDDSDLDEAMRRAVEEEEAAAAAASNTAFDDSSEDEEAEKDGPPSTDQDRRRKLSFQARELLQKNKMDAKTEPKPSTMKRARSIFGSKRNSHTAESETRTSSEPLPKPSLKVTKGLFGRMKLGGAKAGTEESNADKEEDVDGNAAIERSTVPLRRPTTAKIGSGRAGSDSGSSPTANAAALPPWKQRLQKKQNKQQQMKQAAAASAVASNGASEEQPRVRKNSVQKAAMESAARKKSLQQAQQLIDAQAAHIAMSARTQSVNLPKTNTAAAASPRTKTATGKKKSLQQLRAEQAITARKQSVQRAIELSQARKDAAGKGKAPPISSIAVAGAGSPRKISTASLSARKLSPANARKLSAAQARKFSAADLSALSRTSKSAPPPAAPATNTDGQPVERRRKLSARAVSLLKIGNTGASDATGTWAESALPPNATAGQTMLPQRKKSAGSIAVQNAAVEANTRRKQSLQGQPTRKKSLGRSIRKKSLQRLRQNGNHSDRKSFWERKTLEQAASTNNVFSEGYDAEASANGISVNDKGYGKARSGSKTAERAKAASEWVDKEISRLVQEIESISEGTDPDTGNDWCTFGKLFDHYQDISDTLVGILMRAKKRKKLDYIGEMLFQGKDANVKIKLLK